MDDKHYGELLVTALIAYDVFSKVSIRDGQNMKQVLGMTLICQCIPLYIAIRIVSVL